MAVAVTTNDNPFDYFDDFDNWLLYDIEKGYHTLEVMSRLTYTSTELSDAVYEAEIERVVNDMVYHDVINLEHPDIHYVKVTQYDKE